MDNVVDKPCKTCESSHLEDLGRITLGQRDLLIWQLLVEDTERQLEVFEFLKVTNRHSERINEHWNDTKSKLHVVSNIISEPHDNIGKNEDPNDADEKCERVVVVISLT